MNKQQQNQLACESINRAIESIQDGIVVEYHDHLSMDAFKVYVRKGGKTVKIDTGYRCKRSNEEKREVIIEEKLEDGTATECLEVCMTTSSSYYGTAGLQDILPRLKKKYEVPIYFLNIGWYTFPHAYRDLSNYYESIKRNGRTCGAELYTCDYKIVETED